MNQTLNERLREIMGVCLDCDGEGFIGTAKDGRKISCETCGGHEDALGRGYFLNMSLSDTITAIKEAIAERIGDSK